MRTIDHIRTTAPRIDPTNVARAAESIERMAHARKHKQARSKRGTARNARPTIGRNDPCPMHPDRKFKRCPCYAAFTAARSTLRPAPAAPQENP